MNVGDIVLFITNANTRRHDEQAAIVTKIHGDDVLDLVVFGPKASDRTDVPRLTSEQQGGDAWQAKSTISESQIDVIAVELQHRSDEGA